MLLKRRSVARQYRDEDWHFLWAAYAHGKGSLDKRLFPDGISQEEFPSLAKDIVGNIPAVFTLLGQNTKKGLIPVGLAVVGIEESKPWLHFEWFWWATPRNKLETAVRFILKYRDDMVLFAAVPNKSREAAFAERLGDFGVMRRIGTSFHWDGPTALFETRGV